MSNQPYHPNDKPAWLVHGQFEEVRFVREVAPLYGLPARINPDKRFDPCAPDLLVAGRIAELKAQRTPFFTVGCRGLDPQYTVTLNKRAVERYEELGVDFDIYFWVGWEQLSRTFSGRPYSVCPMEGVWRIALSEVNALIAANGAPLHRYASRAGDTLGNAEESYLLDLTSMDRLQTESVRAA